MFKKVLVANRGEIAVRVIRSCHTLGVKTVAIYSEADREAPHVKMADEAYLVGESPVAKSYLNIDSILGIAKDTGVDAIHPGYGFVSENPDFARRCESAGITFIGPPADVIALMGSKIEARKAMEEAGVPVVPGISLGLSDVEEAVDAAEKMGFPVMLKASAGGGGIGMQVVRNSEELRRVFAGNQNRARNFFGDGAMYLEKFIESARHIEIQIFADSLGRVIHLWDRECSIQRRHQKVIEEAPSPFLNESTRLNMGKSAVLAAKSLGYQNAGTIEFLVDDQQNYYFLEMNTRLQVEHPVTEEITGLDLVELQLDVAAGCPLPFKQEDIKAVGHAIEYRLYAEDPERFIPSPGKLEVFALPRGEGIRVDAGVEEGNQVTPFYDPMIAKLIVSGSRRGEVLDRSRKALAAFQVKGIKTNIPLLSNIVNQPDFIKGKYDTAFLSKLSYKTHTR